MSRSRLCGLLVVTLATPQLQGCLTAMAAAQMVPVVAGGAILTNTEEHDPFKSHVQYEMPSADDDLAAMDARIRRAECGEAESQYWLASRMNNSFNESPDKIEIYMWYRLAEMGGYAPASEKLSALGDRMTVSQISQARARARAWHPAHEDCSSGG